MCLCLVYQWILIIGNNAGLTGNPHVIHFSTTLGFQDQASYFLSLGLDRLIQPPLFIRLCTVSLIVYWYQLSSVRWLEKRPPLMMEYAYLLTAIVSDQSTTPHYVPSYASPMTSPPPYSHCLGFGSLSELVSSAA